MPEAALDYPNRIDLAKALDMRFRKRMTYNEIGRVMGVSKQAVHERLARYTKLIGDPEDIQAHDDHVDRILTGAMSKIINAVVDEKKIERCSTYQLAASYGILFDKQRLVRGQSTAIVDHVDLTADEREQMRRLEAMMIDQDQDGANLDRDASKKSPESDPSVQNPTPQHVVIEVEAKALEVINRD